VSRQIHKSPGLKVLVIIIVVAVLTGFVTLFLSGADLTARSTLKMVKLGVVVSSVVGWLIYSAIEKRRPRRRPSRVTRAPRSAPLRRISANPDQEVAPAIPAASARPPAPEPPLDLGRWMEFARALEFDFRDEVLEGRMEDHPARIVPRPRGAELTLTLAAPVEAPISATVDQDGEVTASTDDDDLCSRFLAGDAPTWMIALGEPTLMIEKDRVTVRIDRVTVDLDLLRGMLICAAAGARAAE